MMVIKSLLIAGFMLATAFADSGVSKPPMATLHVQSNFDFSLTSKEFRVHYSGLGGFTTSDSVDIKIYKKDPEEEIHSFTIEKNEQEKPKIYHFALEKASDGQYEVAVCAGNTCSDRNPALTAIVPFEDMKITCKRVRYQSGNFVETEKPFEEKFFGPGQADWIAETSFTEIESKINGATGKDDYRTDFTKLSMSKNPEYKSKDKLFYAAVTYEIKRFSKLFDKAQKGREQEGHEYADEFCERKYLLSAHAHIVDKKTKEVVHRFKTTLFLSEGGKQLFVLSQQADKVHVEMSHKGEEIKAGNYHLWITFCATEKDAIDSTFCAEPLIKQDFTVDGSAE